MHSRSLDRHCSHHPCKPNYRTLTTCYSRVVSQVKKWTPSTRRMSATTPTLMRVYGSSFASLSPWVGMQGLTLWQPTQGLKAARGTTDPKVFFGVFCRTFVSLNTLDPPAVTSCPLLPSFNARSLFHFDGNEDFQRLIQTRKRSSSSTIIATMPT